MTFTRRPPQAAAKPRKPNKRMVVNTVHPLRPPSSLSKFSSVSIIGISFFVRLLYPNPRLLRGHKMCAWLGTASLGLRQIIRYEPYSNGSFSDSGCDSVHGAGADVACGEDAWDRGLEKHGFAGFFPGLGKCLGDCGIASGEH